MSKLTSSLPWRSTGTKFPAPLTTSVGPVQQQQQTHDPEAAVEAALNELLRRIGAGKKPLGKNDTIKAVAALLDSISDSLRHVTPLATAPGPAQRRGAMAAAQPQPGVPWPRIFHKRMLAAQDLISPETGQRLLDAVRTFLGSTGAAAAAPASSSSTDDLPVLHSLPPPPSQPPPHPPHQLVLTQSQPGGARGSSHQRLPTARGLAESLADYLATHALDPDNSLLGMWAAASVAGPLQQTAGSTAQLTFGRTAESAQQMLQALPRLLDTVASWAVLPDADLCAKVRAFADELPNCFQLLRRGTLVAVRLPTDSQRRLPPRTVYGRVATGVLRGDGACIRVTLDPLEGTVQAVPIGDVAVVPRHVALRPATATANPCQDILDVVLVDATELLLNTVSRHAAERCPDANIDAELVRRILRGDIGLRDTDAVQASFASFSAILSDDAALTQFVNAANVPFVDKIPSTLERIAAGDLPVFPLLRNKAVAELQEADILQLVRNMVKSARDSCRATLDTLNTEREEVRNGVRKIKVTEWYLALIRESVNEFLTTKGFDHGAVPQYYIEQPPTSIEAVQKNLAIVRSILEAGNVPTSELGAFITRISSKIYPVLDRLVDSMKYIIATEFRLSVDSPNLITEATTKLASMDQKDCWLSSLSISISLFCFSLRTYILLHFPPPLPPSEARYKLYNDLIKDVAYVVKMKELESAGRVSGMDIVPISGLIAGRFTRFENELQTVLSIWGPKAEASATAQAPH